MSHLICIRRCITSWKILFWLIYKLVHRYCVELNYNWNNTKSIIKVRYNYQRFSKVWLLRTLYDDVMLHNLYINHTLWLSNSHTMLFSKFIIIFTIAQRNMIFTRSKSCREVFLEKNFLPKPQNQVHFNFFYLFVRRVHFEITIFGILTRLEINLVYHGLSKSYQPVIYLAEFRNKYFWL